MAKYSTLSKKQLTEILAYYDEIAPENESTRELCSRISTLFDHSWFNQILNNKKLHPYLIAVTEEAAKSIWKSFQVPKGENKQLYKELPLGGSIILCLQLGVYPEDILTSWLWEHKNIYLEGSNFETLEKQVTSFNIDPNILLQKIITEKLKDNINMIKMIDEMYKKQQLAASAKK